MADPRIVITAEDKTRAAFASVKQSLGSTKEAAVGLGNSMASLAAGAGLLALGGLVKSAINAGDETNKLSQKIGVAAKDVAGLELAYKQAGLGSEVLTGSIAKLSKGIADNNIGLQALGIKTKDAAGNFKGTTAVLGEVADAFKQMPDGVQKSALAMELFGKSGTQLIPLLNGGSEGLRAMAEMADKLGLSIDDSAAKASEEFNDTLELLGMGVQGVGRKVAAELLPTLNSLAGSMLESMTSGDKLARTAQVLGAGLKILYSIAVGVVEIFSTMGKAWGGAFAALGMALSGNFSGAANALKEMAADVGKGWKDSAATIARAWTEEGNAAVAGAAKTMGAGKGLLASAREREEAAKRAAAEAKKAAEEYDKLINKLYGKDLGFDANFQQELSTLTNEYIKGHKNIERYREEAGKLIALQPYMQKAEKEAMAIAQERSKQRNAENDQIDETVRANKAERETREKSAQSLLDGIVAETAALGDSQLQREQSAALRELERTGIDKTGEAYERLALAIPKAVADREAAKENQRLWESIDKTAHDVFTNIFDGGTNVFKKLKDTAKAVFFDWLYGMTARKWIINIAGSMGLSAPGMASAGGTVADAASTAGGMMSNIGGLSGVAGMLGTFGGGLSAGFGGLMGSIGSLFGAAGTGATLGGALSAGSIALGAGNIMGGLGTIVGALGPIGLGIAAITMLLAKGRGETRAGGQYVNGELVSAPSGGELGGSVLPDAMNATAKAINDTLKALGSGLIVDKIVAGIEQSEKGKGFAYAGGALSDGTVFGQGIDGQGYMNRRGNMTAEEAGAAGVAELEQAILQGLQAAANSAWGNIPEVIATELRGQDFDAMGDEARKAVLARINGVIAAVQAFGLAADALPFAQLKGLTFDLTATFIEASGGLEQALGNLSGYVQNFYTETERQQMTAEGISETLQGVGLNYSAEGILGGSRDQFRKLVESIDTTTASGVTMYAAFMSVQDAFASLHPIVDQTATTATDAGTALGGVDTALNGVSTAAGDAAAALEKTKAQTAFWYETFTTPDKKRQDTAQMVTDTLNNSGLGIAISVEDVLAGTRDDVTAYMAQFKAMGEQGQPFVDLMLSLGEAFASLTAPIEQAAAAVRDIAANMANLSASTAQLQIELMRAQGDEPGAAAAQRALDTAGWTDAEIALYDFNAAMRKTIEATNAAKQAEQALASERASLEMQILEAKGDTAAIRKLKLAAADPSLHTLMLELWALQDAAGGAVGAVRDIAANMANLSASTAQLQIDLMRAQGDEPGAAAAQRAIDTAGWTDAEIAIYDFNAALRETITAANAAKQAEEALANERASLEMQLLELKGDTPAIRALRLAALDPSLHALQNEIWQLQDAAAGAATGTNALAEAVDRTRANLVSGYQREASALEGTISRLRDFARGIKDFRDSLLLDGALSPLNPAQQYAEALRQFKSTAAAARGGDSDAQQRLQGAATAFLEASGNMFGSADQYTSDFSMVQSALGKLASSANSQAARAQRELANVKEQLALLGSIDEEAKTISELLAEYLAAVQAAIVSGVDPNASMPAVAATVPAFAAGGLHAGGLALVGERGPELAMLPSSRIYNAAQTRSILSSSAANDAAINELREVRKELQRLQSAVREGDAMNAGATMENGAAVSAAMRNAGSMAAHTERLRAGARPR